MITMSFFPHYSCKTWHNITLEIKRTDSLTLNIMPIPMLEQPIIRISLSTFIFPLNNPISILYAIYSKVPIRTIWPCIKSLLPNLYKRINHEVFKYIEYCKGELITLIHVFQRIIQAITVVIEVLTVVGQLYTYNFHMKY